MTCVPVQPVCVQNHGAGTVAGSLMADVQAAALTHPGCREKTSAAQGTLLAPRLRSTATRAACRVSLFLSEPLGRSLSETRRLFLLHHPLLTSLKDHTE